MNRIWINSSPVKALVVLATLSVLFVALVGVGLAQANVTDSQVGRCGEQDTDVQTAFNISAASRLWEYLPAMGLAPHLARDEAPAYVIVFRDDYVLDMSAAVPRRGQSETVAYHNLICVVQANGEINLYADVSRAGFRTP